VLEPKNFENMKRAITAAIAIIVATCAQVALIGINGLTLLSIPLTIHLGLNVIERATEEPTK
jgi:hypothetical protein